MTPARVELLSSARIPNIYGTFILHAYSNSIDEKEHLAFVHGDVENRESVPVRVHSECFTGDVLGSQRCDCGEQLDRSMELITQAGFGVVVYMRQEGRGIGLAEKLKAYVLQDQGYDTVDANVMLGHQPDARDYTIAALILESLGVRSVRLMTNNPAKIEELTRLGIAVVDRIPLLPQRVNENNRGYLKTKVLRMNHLMEIADRVEPATPVGRTAPR